MKILLAVDGTVSSLAAAQFLARLPHGGPIDITVMTVVTGQSASHAYEPWYPEFMEQLATEKISVEIQLVESLAIGQSLLDAADEFQSSMIVVGDTGKSEIRRILLGSVSRFVLQHATQSVWIVRRRKAALKQVDE